MDERSAKVKVGDKAKNFTLKDQASKDISLRGLKGKRILLSFHPLAATRICADQMKALEAAYDTFEKLNTVPLGISVDAIPAKAAWSKEMGLQKLRILSDFWPHGKVAKLYGVFRKKDGFSERANIIIGEDGKIEFMKIYPIHELPDLDEIIGFLEKKK